MLYATSAYQTWRKNWTPRIGYAFGLMKFCFLRELLGGGKPGILDWGACSCIKEIDWLVCLGTIRGNLASKDQANAVSASTRLQSHPDDPQQGHMQRTQGMHPEVHHLGLKGHCCMFCCWEGLDRSIVLGTVLPHIPQECQNL